MSSASTTDEVALATRQVLESSNLDEINEKKLRQLVQERTGADTSLPDLKALIHSVVEEFLEQDRDGDAPEEGPRASVSSRGGKPKKRKAEGEEEEDRGVEDEDEGEVTASRGAKGGSAKQPVKKFQVGDNKELIVCKLSNKRKVTVGEFKGTLFVSIREFYEKDGQERPGKGISLPVEQWNVLAKHVHDVEAAIKQAQS